MFNQYPYININDFNLDWIIAQIRKLRHDVEDFVNMNAIKYADPIDWDITKQYEKNTVVIDVNTGVAYLSVAPVPAGVNITRPEYWTVIFDLSQFITAGVKNLANSYESALTYTATVPTLEGGWVVWNGTLYEAQNNINVGDAYVVGGNIIAKTVESFVADVITAIGNEATARINADNLLDGRITQEVTDRTNADTALGNRITNEVGLLSNLNTTDKTSVVNAINEVLSDLSQEITDRGNADTALGNRITNEVGLLSNLNTTDKSNIVAAINETLAAANAKTVKDYGAVGDGVTDDTAAIEQCISENIIVIFPQGNYVWTASGAIHNRAFIGSDAKILMAQSVQFYDCVVTDLVIDTVNGTLAAGDTTFNGCSFLNSRHAVNVNNAIDVLDGSNIVIDNCYFDGDNKATMGIWADDSAGTAHVSVRNTTFTKFYLNAIFTTCQMIIVDNCYFIDNHVQVVPNGGGQIDINAKAGVKTNACVRNCQFFGGYTATCGIETAGAYGLFITIQDNVINATNGTWSIALQNGTFATITGNFLYSNPSYPNIATTDGSQACTYGNYYVGTKFSNAADIIHANDFN